MADAQRISVNVFFATMALAALALIGLGVMYLFGPEEGLEGRSPEQEQTTATMSGTEAETMDGYPQDLVLVDYQLDAGPGVVSGTVMNNTNKPFVNVQVGFELLAADSTRLASVRDTTSEVGPGGSWIFNIVIPEDTSPAYVVRDTMFGTVKDVVGTQADPPTNPYALRDSVVESGG